MLYNDFCTHIKDTVSSLMGVGYKIELLDVEKLNGLVLKGLVITKKEIFTVSTIYLEDYYQKYQRGLSIHLVTQNICDEYREKYQIQPHLVKGNPLEFSQLQDKIYFRLINHDMNKTYLEKVPHIKWMDLPIIFSVLLNDSSSEIGSFTITNDILNLWQVTLDVILNLAKSNTFHLFPPKVQTMYEVICDLLENDMAESAMIDTITSDDTPQMYIASNTRGINGASWLFYENELQKVSNRLNSNIYILPSSIHEVILLPATKEISKSELLLMVNEVNTTEVAQEDILSNNVYYYDRASIKLNPLF